MDPSSDPTVPVQPTLRDPVNSVDPRAKTLWRIGPLVLGVLGVVVAVVFTAVLIYGEKNR